MNRRSALGPPIGVSLPVVSHFFVGVPFSMLRPTVLDVLIGVGDSVRFRDDLGGSSEQNWVIAGMGTGAVGIVIVAITIMLTG